MQNLFHTGHIRGSLISFLENFESINERLSLHREEFTEDMVDNLVCAYDFLNEIISKQIDLFSPAGMHSMLELNYRVLCGDDATVRYEYHAHVLKTRQKFHKQIKDIKNWVLKSKDKVSPVTLATGFYCRMLSQPQLFIEGNHRTGNIILNYMLVQQGYAPFLISEKTGYDYLELSGWIKFTDKASLKHNLLRMPQNYKDFEKFLSKSVDHRYVRRKS